MKTEGYELKVGETVYYKCKVVNILPNCVVLVKSRNLGEDVKFICHVNSLKKENK
jgi:hypothetical protein